MWTMFWQVKASKWCNLRCRYCYEWDELGERERIPLEGWNQILIAVKRYHGLQVARFGGPGLSIVAFHGGEPLALPESYWRAVLGLARRILGPGGPEADFSYAVHTNLYAAPPGILDLLRDYHFRMAVSLDTVPGVRLTAGGKETELRVAGHIDQLLDRGIPVTCNVVLAGHTRDRLRDVHDYFAGRGIPFKLTPLFDGPPLADNPDLAITADEAAGALEDLFVYWVARGCRASVFNLTSYLNTVLLRLAGLERLAWDARANGERVFTVNTDGTLWTPAELYRPGQSVGNLFRQSLVEVLASPAYEASLRRREQLARRHCHGCRYAGACDGEPVFSTRRDDPPGPCPIAARVCRFIEKYLGHRGFDGWRVRTELAIDGPQFRASLSTPTAPQQRYSTEWTPCQSSSPAALN